MKTARIVSDWIYNSLTLIISTLCISLIYALGSEIINDNSKKPFLPKVNLFSLSTGVNNLSNIDFPGEIDKK